MNTDKLFFKKSDLSDKLEDIVATLRQHGLVLVPDFFNDQEISDLDSELKSVFDTLELKDIAGFDGGPPKVRGGQYPPGKALLIHPPSYHRFPHIINLFMDNSFLNKVVDSYYSGPCNKFMQVFTYHDTLLRDEGWIDGITHSSALHFDPYQSLKFGGYLTDTSRQNAMTRIVPGSQWEGKHLRENVLKETLWKGTPILDCHKHFKKSKYTEEDAVCPVVSAGTLVIFDTDCWNGGGEILEKGLERKLILFHNRAH